MITEVAGKQVQTAASIEVGIINPKAAPILIAQNGCVALDMNECKPSDLRELADLLEGKPVKKKTIKKISKK
jgi:hypothetical protein